MSNMHVPSSQSIIKLENFSIEFPLFHGGSRSLKKTLFSKAGKFLVNTQQQYRKTGAEIVQNNDNNVVIQALKDLTVTIHSGERVGLIGHNGAGKSTLLRAITGIFEPIKGSITTRGTIEALLDTSAGMNMELSGRQNIYLRGKHFGLSNKEIQTLEKDIETFSELNEFLDLPLKIYSSGMIMRLGFGVATSIAPNILLMDEWFMAGDSIFQEKAKIRLEGIVNSADIVVLTTHSLPIIQEWCNRVIWMEGGKIIGDGPTDKMIENYKKAMQNDSA